VPVSQILCDSLLSSFMCEGLHTYVLSGSQYAMVLLMCNIAMRFQWLALSDFAVCDFHEEKVLSLYGADKAGRGMPMSGAMISTGLARRFAR
jgi:hypothetical protein